ncbi:MAG: hypothetical protein ACLSA2_03485 [Candidatus Gastranaerophilaceae bacterium]
MFDEDKDGRRNFDVKFVKFAHHMSLKNSNGSNKCRKFDDLIKQVYGLRNLQCRF